MLLFGPRKICLPMIASALERSRRASSSNCMMVILRATGYGFPNLLPGRDAGTRSTVNGRSCTANIVCREFDQPSLRVPMPKNARTWAGWGADVCQGLLPSCCHGYPCRVIGNYSGSGDAENGVSGGAPRRNGTYEKRGILRLQQWTGRTKASCCRLASTARTPLSLRSSPTTTDAMRASCAAAGAGERGACTKRVIWSVRDGGRGLTSISGAYSCELLYPYAAQLLGEPLQLMALASAAATLDRLLPERAPHPEMFDAFHAVLKAFRAGDGWLADFVRWELSLLSALGYGLDLSRCAATGIADGLIYVSPRTGHAVSAAAGEPLARQAPETSVFPEAGDLRRHPSGNLGRADVDRTFPRTLCEGNCGAASTGGAYAAA